MQIFGSSVVAKIRSGIYPALVPTSVLPLSEVQTVEQLSVLCNDVKLVTHDLVTQVPYSPYTASAPDHEILTPLWNLKKATTYFTLRRRGEREKLANNMSK